MKKPPVWPVFAAAIAAYGAMPLVRDGLNALFGTAAGTSQPAGRLAAAGLCAFGVFGLLAVLSTRPPRVQSLRLGAGRFNGQNVFAIVAGAAAVSGIFDAVGSLLGAAEPDTWTNARNAVTDARGPALLGLVLALGVLSAAGQDLFFRGAMQTALSRRFGAAAAIGVTSVAFALIQKAPATALGAALLGVYAGLATEWTDSVRAGIAAHVTHNTLSILLAPLEGVGREPAANLARLVLSLGILAAALLWLRRGLAAPPATLQPE